MRTRWVWRLALAGFAVAVVLFAVWVRWRPAERDAEVEPEAIADLDPEPEPEELPAVAACAFEVHSQGDRVYRKNADGGIPWSFQLKGYLGGVRPPHLLFDSRRADLSHNGGVTALDCDTGKVVWQKKGPEDRLLLDGELLLATQCEQGDEIAIKGRWLVALAVATGAEVFRVQLPQEGFDPEPIRKVAGLYLVQEGGWGSGRYPALLIDRKGRVRHRLARPVIDGVQQGADRVFLTDESLIRLNSRGKFLWSVPTTDSTRCGGAGGLVRLTGGDLIAFTYGPISDSGVGLMRIDPASGAVCWRTDCAPLLVDHSKYRHRATVEAVAGQIKVVSEGSSGTFTELLDPETGRQQSRHQPRD